MEMNRVWAMPNAERRTMTRNEFISTGFFHPLGSIRLIESVWCTVSEERAIRRTWRERLLSWPWRPWVAEKTIVVQIPDKHVYQIDRYTFVCHPAIAKQVKAQFPT